MRRMTLLHRLAVGLVLTGGAAVAWAQTAPPAAAAAVAAPVTVPKTASAAADAPRDALTPTLTVIEDDGVRIEETRLRGQPLRITVQSKLGQVRAYEIIVGSGGRDPSQDRGAAGQRAWSLFSF